MRDTGNEAYGSRVRHDGMDQGELKSVKHFFES